MILFCQQHGYDICMMMKIKTPERRGKTSSKEKLIVGFSRVVTTDTTNKDPRPEDPRKVRGREADYRIFWRCVDLLDTTNKKSLFRR